MKVQTVRKFAMALEAVTEEPHHHFLSFRVRGKIFVTIPPDEQVIHVFVVNVGQKAMGRLARGRKRKRRVPHCAQKP